MSKNSRSTQIPGIRWRDPTGVPYQIVAMIYIAAMYGFGLFAIVSSSLLLNIVGALALAHSLIIAAYLLHECAHQSVFISAKHNARLGSALAWLTGACYSGFERVRRKHLRHHIEQADILAWDYRSWLARHPSMRMLVEFAESLYLPAVEMLMHSAAIILPFIDSRYREHRMPIATMLIVRTAAFALLGWLHPPALLCYAIAYVLFMQVLRFMDVFQHSYIIRYTLTEPQQRIKTTDDYEESHTFSNLISQRWPWLNLLVLNFCYHNVHHQMPLLPWYRLPQRYREVYGNSCPQRVPLSDQLRWFQRYRRERVMAPAVDQPAGPLSKNIEMVGATGVSFITAV